MRQQELGMLAVTRWGTAFIVPSMYEKARAYSFILSPKGTMATQPSLESPPTHHLLTYQDKGALTLDLLDGDLTSTMTQEV